MARKLSMEELHRISVQEFKEAEKLPLTVVLDNVRSQNNIGSVFRTGDAFRVERICLCGICSTPPHRDIHKTALGAEDSVDWTYYEETADCIRQLKTQGYKVYAIEQVDDSIKLDNLSTFNFQLSTQKLPSSSAMRWTGCRRSCCPYATVALRSLSMVPSTR